MGDSIQTLKAGSLEIGDIIVVTKADRPEANDLARDLRRLRTLTLEPVVEHEAVWQAPVLKTSAVRQEGTDALLDAIDKHRAWLEMTGNLATRQREIAVAEITTRVQADLQRVAQRQSTLAGGFGGVIDEVIARQMTPHRAASALVSRIAPSGDIDHE